MVRGGFQQIVAEEAPQRERVGAARGDRSFARQVFEKSHHQHFQINHRVDPRPSSFGLQRVGRPAELPDLLRKAHLLKGALDQFVKATRARLRQAAHYDPELALFLCSLALFKHAPLYISSRPQSPEYFNSLLGEKEGGSMR